MDTSCHLLEASRVKHSGLHVVLMLCKSWGLIQITFVFPAFLTVAYSSWAKCLTDLGDPPPFDLDHTRFLDMPGQVFTAKKQCEILLRDKDAVMAPNQQKSTVCYSLQCKTPHRSGYYFSGPALEGTECGAKKVSLTMNPPMKHF